MAKVLQVGGFLVKHHLVISEDGVDLIDSGFVGGVSWIKKALRAHDKTFTDVRSILLTHGHLDHTFNLARLKKLTGCDIYAPLADRAHLEGTHHYRAWSRVAGLLQALGRLVLRYQKPTVDHWFNPGDLIHDYEVIGLPGHTIGHCGFLLKSEKLLFAGDLFSHLFGKPSIPPRILNDDHEEAIESIRKASTLGLEEVYLNHTNASPPSDIPRTLRQLAQKHKRRGRRDSYSP